jgi:hypothetical protein
MHGFVVNTIKTFVQKTRYLVINCDEVTTINNQSWCNFCMCILWMVLRGCHLLLIIKVGELVNALSITSPK